MKGKKNMSLYTKLKTISQNTKLNLQKSQHIHKNPKIYSTKQSYC